MDASTSWLRTENGVAMIIATLESGEIVRLDLTREEALGNLQAFAAVMDHQVDGTLA